MRITKHHGLIEHSGEALTAKQWAGRIGITVQALYYRLARRSIADAVGQARTPNRQLMPGPAPGAP